MCIASARHPAIVDGCTLAQFGAAGHLVYRPAVGGHRSIDERIVEQCAAHDLVRQEVLQVSYGPGIADLIARTDLIASVPLELGEWCARHGDVKVHPLPVDIGLVELSQYWHERSHHDAGLVWLRRLAREIFVGPA